ncbi:hypothetical protein I7I50_02226 [Histoplasma capsulatum G186AR]|uniref:Uncharacterized protein n=1 Tax=Ajellomyces capsulatus TaxID=5037 RepID=A0A8H7Z7G2_AJECA|nr:hypothetical protein I7I52_01110 [Histoplasma capsulatum]QSS71406.1 hypothetical protein I7I50_02226 [Histoplasma capsulatum G186AR]
MLLTVPCSLTTPHLVILSSSLCAMYSILHCRERLNLFFFNNTVLSHTHLPLAAENGSCPMLYRFRSYGNEKLCISFSRNFPSSIAPIYPCMHQFRNEQL